MNSVARSRARMVLINLCLPPGMFIELRELRHYGINATTRWDWVARSGPGSAGIISVSKVTFASSKEAVDDLASYLAGEVERAVNSNPLPIQP